DGRAPLRLSIRNELFVRMHWEREHSARSGWHAASQAQFDHSMNTERCCADILLYGSAYRSSFCASSGGTCATISASFSSYLSSRTWPTLWISAINALSFVGIRNRERNRQELSAPSRA